MGIFMSLMVFLLIVASGVPGLLPKSDSPALTYWEEKLPNTPIPNTLRELIVRFKSEDMDVDVDKGGVKPGGVITGVGVHLKPSVVIRINYANPATVQTLSDPSLSMFFLEKDLRAGTKMWLHLFKRSNGAQYFLPRHLSDKIPFSSDKLSVALRALKIPEGSETAQTMKGSVKQCESPAFNEERKYCATSLESMIDYSTSELGTNHVNVLVTDVPKNSVRQQYTFTAVPFQSRSKPVVCHSQMYAYAVYYCHQAKHTKAVRVSLKGGDGSRAEGVALCHADTSLWNPKHVAFMLLNVKPGAAVCHFITQDHVVWLSAN